MEKLDESRTKSSLGAKYLSNRLRRVVDAGGQAKSTNKVTVHTCIKETEDYKKFVNTKVLQIAREDPSFPAEYLPTAKFEATVLKIRKKEGEEPIHTYMRWTSKDDCGNEDVNFLIEFLDTREIRRDCHINTGVHGKVDADGNFDFAWKNDGKYLFGQDVESATDTKNNVSLHEITQNPFAPPIYHVGVDTIDGFCKSAYYEPSENTLNIAYENFLIQQKQQRTSGAAQGESVQEIINLVKKN